MTFAHSEQCVVRKKKTFKFIPVADAFVARVCCLPYPVISHCFPALLHKMNTPSAPLQFYTHPMGFVHRGPWHPHGHDSVSAHRPACSRAKHLSCLLPGSRCLRESVWGQTRGKKARWMFVFFPKCFPPLPPFQHKLFSLTQLQLGEKHCKHHPAKNKNT